MDSVRPPEQFDFETEDQKSEWKSWKQAFILWLVGTEKTRKNNEVKIGLLLTLMGRKAQDVYNTFDWNQGENQTFDAVVQKFDAYFEPRANKTMARFKFFTCQQGDATVKGFITELKRLAEPCEFGEMRDELIKDMLVIHCKDLKLQERLLRESDLELRDATRMAYAAEETQKDLQLIRDEAGERGREDDKALAARGPNTGTGRNQGSNSRNSGHRGDHGERRQEAWSGAGGNQQSDMWGKCFKCKEYGHMIRDCPQRDSQRVADKGGGNRGTGSYTQCNYAEDEQLLLAAQHGQGKKNNGWYLDSGASKHMCHKRSQMRSYRAFRNPYIVRLGDGETVKAYGIGEVVVSSKSGRAVVLKDVLYIPELFCSVVSVQRATDRGARVLFTSQGCEIRVDGNVCLVGVIDDYGLYSLGI